MRAVIVARARPGVGLGKGRNMNPMAALALAISISAALGAPTDKVRNVAVIVHENVELLYFAGHDQEVDDSGRAVVLKCM